MSAYQQKVVIGDAVLYQGDCMEILPGLAAASFDMVLCDLPYGTTQNKWDSVIPLDALWIQYCRISKSNAAVVLTAAQPFTSRLITSRLDLFKYTWVWQKSRPTGHMNANKQPLREHEDVCVFYREQPTYNPQFTRGSVNHVSARPGVNTASTNYGRQYEFTPEVTERKHPKSILPFAVLSPTDSVHPTQKPVPLMEYLARTYTDAGDCLLDNAMGSGTTGVAAAQMGRKFTGIERDAGYFAIACQRIERAYAQGQLFEPERAKQVQEALV